MMPVSFISYGYGIFLNLLSAKIVVYGYIL